MHENHYFAFLKTPNKFIVMRLKLYVFLFVIAIKAQAQITLNFGDFSKVNDTVRYSSSSSMINYEATGANYVWSFGNLKVDNQDVQKYISPATTPYILQFFSASYGLSESSLSLGPLGGGAASNVFSFYKSTNQSLVIMGRGATVQSLPLGITYSLKDTLMKFPMSYGKTFSGSYLGEASLPTLGALKQSGSRTTTVDGWGQITTPYGTFDCLRIKSVVVGTDSIVFGGFGIPIPAARTEYSWIAKSQGFPILEVVVNNTTNAVSSIKYKDIFRPEAYINNCNFNANRVTGKPGDTINFSNSSYGSPKSFVWQITPATYSFVPGSTASSENPRVIFNEIGDYSVKLTSIYEGASDDTLKTNFIKIREGAIANFYATNVVPKLNETIGLRDTSTGNVVAWLWTITPNTGVVYLNGTSTVSQHPQVQFNVVGNYNVQLRVTNAIGNNTLKKTNYIQVWPTSVLDQNKLSGINFFPNPGKDFIRIETENLAPIQAKIFNAMGQEVLVKILNNQHERRISVEGLPRGIYFLELVQTEQKTLRKLILE
jgi:PKD repeat protein